MKKSKNWGLLIAGLAVLGGGAWFIINRARKTYQELGRREEENREILEKSGLKEEDLDKKAPLPGDPDYGVDTEIYLPRLIYEEAFQSNLEDDCLDLDRAIGGDGHSPSEHVVHIRQRFDTKIKRNVLDFLFEIPLSAIPEDRDSRKFTDGNTCVANFVTAIRGEKNKETGKYNGGLAKEMERIINDSRYNGINIDRMRARCIVDQRIEAYYFVAYKELDDNGEDLISCSAMLPVPKEHYENNIYNSDHTRASDFVGDLASVILEKGPQELEFERKDIVEAQVRDVILTFRVTVKLRDAYHIDGINVKSAIAILEYIADEFNVIGWGGGSFKYTNFVFYAPDELDTLECYDREWYTVEKNGEKRNTWKTVTCEIL